MGKQGQCRSRGALFTASTASETVPAKLPISVLGLAFPPLVIVECRTRLGAAALLPERPLRIALESDGLGFSSTVGLAVWLTFSVPR